MGNLATPEALIARWHEVVEDQTLQDLPYKIELNTWGKVEMTPPSVGRARLQSAVSAQLGEQLKDGVALTECPILTTLGVRAPDVVWASNRFRELNRRSSPLARAPEICVEILSRSNVQAEIDHKTHAYLEAGAEEVWLVSENGAVRFIDNSGERANSRFAVVLTLPDVSTDYL